MAGRRIASKSGLARWPRWPWYQWLFLGLVLLYVLPFWMVHFVPTVDGPGHLYNAWVLLHLGDSGHYPLLGRYFAVDPRPFPNWLTHLLLAGLMWLVPPVVSEKLLLSGYVLVLMGGLWYLAGAVDGERRWLAFIGFLFVYSLPLQFGFYNFCYSLGLFMIAVGYWWRRRDSFDLGAAVKLNLLLWLCYFAHIVSAVVALLAIGVLWLTTLRRANLKHSLLQIAALAPQAALPLWFLLVQGSSPYPANDSFAALSRDFFHFSVFFGLEDQLRLGVVLEVVFALLFALSVGRWLRDRRPEAGTAGDLGFLLLALGFAALFFAAPEGMSGGTLLKIRLAAYPWLILIPWLAPGLRGSARAVSVGALSLLAMLNLGYVVRCYRQIDTLVQRFIHGLDVVERNTVVVPLLFDRYGGCSRTGYLGHTIGYAAIEKGLVDWDDYEAVVESPPRLHHFPLRFKGAARHDTYPFEALMWDVKPRELKEQVDYVYCWKMPAGQRIGRRLRANFTLVSDTGDSQLFQSPRLHASTPEH